MTKTPKTGNSVPIQNSIQISPTTSTTQPKINPNNKTSNISSFKK